MPHLDYGLTSNPFPRGGAIVKPESKDPRENGQIFSVNARQKEILEFEEKFVGTKTSFDNRLRCGFLWAEGDRMSGRGMGKTALALYMKHRVNDGYGKNFFGGNTRFFCGYISFQQQVKAKIAYFYKECFRSLLQEGIFQYIGEQTTRQTLEMRGVQPGFADAISNYRVRRYLESRSRYSLDQMSTQWDNRFVRELPNLFFAQTTRALRAAGFSGGILIVDDIENITDQSTGREIQYFVENLGLTFFATPFGGAQPTFYTLVFTTHQQSAEKLSSAWKSAGLANSYPLSPRANSSILVRKPDAEQCVDMITQYLSFFRDPSFTPPHPCFPFTQEAIEVLMVDSRYHPRVFLSRLGRLVSEASEADEREITRRFVKRSLESDTAQDRDWVASEHGEETHDSP